MSWDGSGGEDAWYIGFGDLQHGYLNGPRQTWGPSNVGQGEAKTSVEVAAAASATPTKTGGCLSLYIRGMRSEICGRRGIE